MPKVAVYNMEGAQVGEMELSERVFGQEMNEPVVHQVIVAQLANKRQGTQSALTRSEVSGGGRKPWRQKGTGRARQGSIRAPQWKHGGVVFAPKPRDYSISVPRKVKRLALKCALSQKVTDNNMLVLESLSLDEIKTAKIAKMLSDLNVDGKALLVLAQPDENVLLSCRNIPTLKTAYVNTINVVDLLSYQKFIVVKDAVSDIEEAYV